MHVRTWMLMLAPVAALVLAPRPAAAQDEDRDTLTCHDQGWGDRAHACEIRELGLPAASAATIHVDGRENGGVAVRGWDRDSVRVVARVKAWANEEADARDAVAHVRISTTGGSIAADGPDRVRHGSWSVDYLVFVPRRADVAVETLNGPISARDIAGRLRADAENGPLVLRDVAGDVRARTENGPLVVALSGSRWDGAGLDAETQNGPVQLELPEHYAAHLEWGTINGPMSVGFPLTVQGRLSKHITTDLGGGGATVRVVTTNGPAAIDRR